MQSLVCAVHLILLIYGDGRKCTCHGYLLTSAETKIFWCFLVTREIENTMMRSIKSGERKRILLLQTFRT